MRIHDASTCPSGTAVREVRGAYLEVFMRTAVMDWVLIEAVHEAENSFVEHSVASTRCGGLGRRVVYRIPMSSSPIGAST